MRRSLLVAVGLLAVTLLAASPAMAQSAEGATGIVLDLGGTQGPTLIILKVPAGYERDFFPGTRIAIQDINVAASGIAAGDKVSFQLQPTAEGGAATGLSLMTRGATLSTNLVVGLDVIADEDDNFVVSNGQVLTIRNGARVDGNIKVDRGTLVIIENASVKGNIKGDNGADIEIFMGSVDGNIHNTKAEGAPEGLIAIESSTINGNIKGENLVFVGVVSSDVDGNIDTKDTQLVGGLDNPLIDGTVHSKNDGLVAFDNNTIDKDLKIDNPQQVLATNNTIGGNLRIKSPIACTESGNVVSKKNSGC